MRVLFLSLAVCTLAAQDRRALLLVNSDYHKLAPRAVNNADLEALKSALAAAKFAVSEERNLAQGQIERISFLSSIKQGDTVLIYYTGYAMQSKGDNFIVPVDYDPAKAGEATFLAQSMTGFFQMLDDKKAGVKMILIDAPEQPAALLPKATGAGLAAPELADLGQIAFLSASALNALPAALDATERGAFARQIAELIRKPGTTLVELLVGAQGSVSKKLSPFSNSTVTSAFRFTDPPPPPKEAPPSKPVDSFISKDRVNSKDRQSYVYIPAGKFLMGCAKDDSKCEEHEKPQHDVTLTKAFWMGETEVTVEAYKRFLEMTDPKKKLPRAPVEHEGWRNTNLPMPAFSYDDAAAFCKFAGGRLPTEAEWEYAARAGKANEIVPLSSENAREKANFHGRKGNDRFDYVAQVKQFDPNAFGLFDMFGNLWEMTSDFYDKGYYAASPKSDPKGPASGKERASRGGSWDSDPAQHLRISFRNKGNGGNIVGWRCVIEDSEETRKLLR
ncbi:MAG: hypothetical protein FJW38_22835 [Acidobacteria bacterium]|nr:hypothetical protein [Acidobacteriota bacterium]